MRLFLTVLFVLLFPLATMATDAPPGQVRIGQDQILRGHFVQDLQAKSAATPMQAAGHFVVAPGHGLIWGVEQPFPTSTIITQNGLAQDLGGVALKLPAKNLRHIYDMVGGALAGDWGGLEQDFVIAQSGNAAHWQMVLTPKPDKPSLPYASITVSGARFVESITMLKSHGAADTFNFSDMTLSPAPLAAQESAIFAEVKQ